MPKVKIVLTTDRYEDDYYSRSILAEGITDWEEITKEELELLRSNLYRIAGRGMDYRMPILLVQDEIPVYTRIASIREFLQKELEKDAAEKKKREAAAAKRKREAKQKELERLQKLAAKHGVQIEIPTSSGGTASEA